MIITTLALFYVLALCFLYGLLLYRMFGWLPNRLDAQISVPQIALAGIGLITALAALASFFIPISVGFHLALLVGAVGMLAWNFRRIIHLASDGLKFIRRHPAITIFFLLATLLAVYEGSREPLNFDTGLYHAQFIRWTETYPVAPGLGNFSDRLAFNSAWLMFASVFHLAWILPLPFHSPGLALYLVLILEVCARLGQSRSGPLSVAGGAPLLFLPLSHLLFRNELSSPGTDLPAALLVWLILVYTLDHAQPNNVSGRPIGFLFLLAGFATTVKLSVAPILLLPLVLWIWEKRITFSAFLQNALILGMILAPWLGRNVILSGYLVYPFPQIDLFSLAWKIPPEKALGAQQSIKAWARVPGRAPEEVLAYSFRVWTMEWWSKLSDLNQALLIITACVMGFFLISLLTLWFKQQARFSGSCRVPNDPKSTILLPSHLVGLGLAVGMLGAVYWFWQAPDIRFGYGFIGILVATPLAVLLVKTWTFRPARIAVFLALAAYQLASLAEMTDFTRWRSRWYVANPYPTIALVEFEQNNFKYFMPDQGTQCWYEAIPCTPFPNSDAYLRGTNTSDGFIDSPDKRP